MSDKWYTLPHRIFGRTHTHPVVQPLKGHVRILGPLSMHCLNLDTAEWMKCEVKDPFSSYLGA